MSTGSSSGLPHVQAIEWCPSASAPWALLGDVHAALRSSLSQHELEVVQADWQSTKDQLLCHARRKVLGNVEAVESDDDASLQVVQASSTPKWAAQKVRIHWYLSSPQGFVCGFWVTVACGGAKVVPTPRSRRCSSRRTLLRPVRWFVDIGAVNRPSIAVFCLNSQNECLVHWIVIRNPAAIAQFLVVSFRIIG